jgi:hypothetical protein
MTRHDLTSGNTRSIDELAVQTLSAEVLAKMKAPSQEASGVPVLTDPSQLEAYDAFLFGIPTRLGNFPAQWRTFWDLTGKQWFAGSFWVCYASLLSFWESALADNEVAYQGKYAGLFVSTGGQGGGQESTALASMSTLAHHGMIYVPLGYKPVFKQLTDLSEVHGGSPWGVSLLFSCSFPFAYLPLCSVKTILVLTEHVHRLAHSPITMAPVRPQRSSSRSRENRARHSMNLSRACRSRNRTVR